MKIRSWSRCWYEEFCSLGRITPTTVNGVSPRNTCCPTGASCSNSSLANSLPSTATRRRSPTSRSLMKRPPASAMMLRIRPYAGTMPVTAGSAARTPRRTRALRVMNSGLMYSISRTSPASSGTSSGRSRMGRPSPNPANGLVVRPPNRITMRSPSPWKRLTVWRSSPTPKASSTTTATVPHAIPMTVSEVRSFCARRSTRNSRHTSGDLARRPLHQRVRHLQTLQHFDVDGIRQAGLDATLLGLTGAGAHGDEARVVALGDEPLRDVEHAVAAGDDHLRVGRVARAQRSPRHLGQRDLDREDRRLLLLVRLEPDLLEPALHAGARERPDLDGHRHALLEPAHVDLVHRAAKDQVPHRGHPHQHGARLVRGERHHRIADLDRVLEDVAVDGGTHHRLHLLAPREHLAAFLQREALLRQRELAARFVHPPLRGLDVGGGNQVAVAQLLLAGQLPLEISQLDLAQLHVAAQLHHFQRRRIGGDLEQRLTPLDEIAHRREALPHHAGENGFDADFDSVLDGADGEGLVDQGSADDRHGFGTVRLLAAELSRGGHGTQAQDGEHGGENDRAALHLRAAPSRRMGVGRSIPPIRCIPSIVSGLAACGIEIPLARIGRRSVDHDSSSWALNPDKESVCVTIHHAPRRSPCWWERSPVPTARPAPPPTGLPATRPSCPRRPPSCWHAPWRSRWATPRSALT